MELDILTSVGQHPNREFTALLAALVRLWWMSPCTVWCLSSRVLCAWLPHPVSHFESIPCFLIVPSSTLRNLQLLCVVRLIATSRSLFFVWLLRVVWLIARSLMLFCCFTTLYCVIDCHMIGCQIPILIMMWNHSMLCDRSLHANRNLCSLVCYFLLLHSLVLHLLEGVVIDRCMIGCCSVCIVDRIYSRKNQKRFLRTLFSFLGVSLFLVE